MAPMSLNIKNPETFRLAHELAELTGESVTGAVTTSVKERLERDHRSRAPSPEPRVKPAHRLGRITDERAPIPPPLTRKSSR